MARHKHTVTRRSTTQQTAPLGLGLGAPSGKKDILGQKRFFKGVDNNMIYAGAAGVVLLTGYQLYTHPWLLRGIPFLNAFAPPPQPGAQVAARSVPTGSAVQIQGSFIPPVPQAFYIVTDNTGKQVAQGSLGNNVSTFSQSIPGLPNGQYVVTVSDQPAPGQSAPAGQSPGLPQGVGGMTLIPPAQGVGAAPYSSGPETIALS